jgi:hypothetical protein
MANFESTKWSVNGPGARERVAQALRNLTFVSDLLNATTDFAGKAQALTDLTTAQTALTTLQTDVT